MSSTNQMTYLQQYFLATSFHGLHFIVANRHWSERLFWALCVISSWIASGFLMYTSYKDYENNAISFVVETSYLDWNTTFPSIAVCETDNPDSIAQVTDSLYGVNHDYNLDEIMKEIVYFRGLTFYTMALCGPDASTPHPQCKSLNFTLYPQLVRSSCDAILTQCRWNTQEFHCCQHFIPIETEMGICYIINSKQTNDQIPIKSLDMISNRATGPGLLEFQLNGYANVYLLGEYEVPTLTTLTTDILTVTPGIHYKRSIAVNEIENQYEVRFIDIIKRKCRFYDEIMNLEVYPYYSYSTCCVQCRKDAQEKLCACAHHLMPSVVNYCQMNGLNCLNLHYNDLTVLKAPWTNRSGLVCDCLPSCTEIELSVIEDEKNAIDKNVALVEIGLERLSMERFKRKVVRGRLDLVVSMGASTALFLGASILSFFELFYWMTLRPFGDWLMRYYRWR